MKNKCYRDSKNKHDIIQKLYHKKAEGNKFVIWKLSNEQIKVVEKVFKISKFDIIIQTRRFYDTMNIHNELLLKINFSARQGKKSITIPFDLKDINLLERFNVKYDIRYKIFL